ncbi:MAG: hypothetical protein KAY32_04150 [Candidatus Eisenbacteria sp.]|nr:hypothetical protein [Candidatus Eisenbacteria bacterium]
MNAHNPQPGGTLEFLVRLLRWRTFILVNTGIVAVLAVVISLLLPNWYEARMSILPPQEEPLGLSGGLGTAGGGMLASLRGGALSITGRLSMPVWAAPSDLVAGVLRSRRLRERVIDEHDLQSVYRSENIDQALDEFDARSKVRVGAEGIVRVAVADKQPERAAAIAATMARVLDEIQHETRRVGVSAVRAFVAARVESTRSELAAAEESLRTFQERYGLLVPDEQARILVKAIAEIEAQRLATQVERDALRAQVGDEHPEVQRVVARLRSLAEAKAELEGRSPGEGAEAVHLERGEEVVATAEELSETDAPPHAAGSERRALIDLGRLPELNVRFLRRYREVGVLEALHGLLVQMHEQYRILEVRDTPTVQILDPPVAPQQKARPHRAVICIVATLLAFLGGLAVATLLEQIARLADEDPPRYARLRELLRGVGLGFLVRG